MDAVTTPMNNEDAPGVRDNLLEIVGFLSQEIGQRSYRDLEALKRSADYIEGRLRDAGCATRRQAFSYLGNTYDNVVAEVRGTAGGEDALVIGAHYDTALYTPGADDNASGIAGLLELARLCSRRQPKRTVRFAAFCLEEPPAYMSKHMGSYVYARSLKEAGVGLAGMISLEMLGYYSDSEGSQYYPSSLFRLIYPDRGNFISFVGNLSSRSFIRRLTKAFRAVSSLPAESLTGPSLIPGVDFSDHRNFWKFGYQALMITDTAFYRNPNYHSPGDTADTLDYVRMAELVTGLHRALATL